MRPHHMLAAALALAVAAAPAMAEAADQQTCVTQAEFAALVGYALPTVLGQVGQTCAASLPADAYLKINAAAVTAHYAPYKPAAWPGAKAAFMKLGGGRGGDADKLIGALPDEALQGIIDATIPQILGSKIKTKDCRTIDRAVQLLAPLPPENTSALVSLIVAAATADKPATSSSLQICQS